MKRKCSTNHMRRYFGTLSVVYDRDRVVTAAFAPLSCNLSYRNLDAAHIMDRSIF